MAEIDLEFSPVTATVKGDGVTTIATAPTSAFFGDVPDVESITTGESAAIQGTLNKLLDLGSTASSTAQVVIDNLLNLQMPDVGSITYAPPTWTGSGAFNTLNYSTPVTYTVPDAEAPIYRKPSSFNDVAAPNSNITQPTITAPDTVPVPSIGTAGLTTPNKPTAYEWDSALQAPSLDLDTLVLNTPLAPTLDVINIQIPDAIDIDSLNINILDDSLLDGIDLLDNFSFDSEIIPEYNQLFTELYTITGSMLSGTFSIIDYLNYTTPTGRIASALSRRNIDIPDEVYAYDEARIQELEANAAKRYQVDDSRERDTVLLEAYRIATDAELILFEIFRGTQDAKFQYSIALAQSQALIAKAAVAAYNAKVLQVTGRITEYNARVAELQARADIALAQARNAQIVGDANKLFAREFSITEGAKNSEATLYKAQVAAEAAKLDAYRAELEAYSADVASAEANMMGYSTSVQEYLANVQAVKNEYDLYSAKTDAVVAQNRQIAAEISSDATKSRALAVEARSKATAASVEGIKNLRRSIDETAYYTSVSTHNAQQDAQISKQLAEFSMELSEASGKAAANSVVADAWARENRAVSDYTTRVIEATSRVASATQGAQDSLARAYARAYEVAGRAGASVESGRLSGFRAQASLSASGSYSYSDGYTTSVTASGTNTWSEDDSYQEKASV